MKGFLCRSGLNGDLEFGRLKKIANTSLENCLTHWTWVKGVCEWTDRLNALIHHAIKIAFNDNWLQCSI